MDKLTDGRVTLRRQEDADAAFFARWLNDPDVMFRCGFTEPTSLQEELGGIRRRREAADRDWFTVTDGTGRILGETGFLRINRAWRCTDYTLILPNPADWRQGFGRAVARLMLGRAFDTLGLNRVAVGVVALNAAAVAFWEAAGFKREGIQAQGYWHDGRFSDFIMMRILREEWEG